MSHLPRQDIRLRIEDLARPLVGGTSPPGSPEFERQLQPDSFDVRIGVVVAGGRQVIDQGNRLWELPPGEMAIIITSESLNMPSGLAAEVGPRLSVLNEGLLVLTAPHVDPGYSGPLSARVINLLDRPFPLKYGELILTVIFYELTAETDRPYWENITPEEKIAKALKESRFTLNRLFHPREDLVLQKDLQRASVVQALTWLALLLPAVFILGPFSLPFFWNVGAELSTKYPWLVRPVAIGAGVVLLPLFVLYLIRSVWLVWFSFHPSVWKRIRR